MNLSFLIAKRYFISRKSKLVNIISAVSLISIAVSTASMLVILSVMNGMNSYIVDKFTGFSPDLKIEAREGKYFEYDFLDKIKSMEGLSLVLPVLEDQALLKHGQEARVIKLKGVPKNYDKIINLSDNIIAGEYDFEYLTHVPLTVGSGIYSQMGLSIRNAREPSYLYIVDANNLSTTKWQQSLENYAAYTVAVFSVMPEYDNKYVFCPIEFAQEALDAYGRASSIEISYQASLTKKEQKKLQKKIQAELGSNYEVKNRIEQKSTLYRSIKSEKWMMIAVFSFVMLVATFTMIASLMLLIYEKRKDIAILSAQGMKAKRIRKIFLIEGALISFFGTLLGIFFGGLVVLGQHIFGWVKFGMGTGGEYILETYPVAWQWIDVAGVCLIGMGIGIVASLLPLKYVNTYKRFNI